MDCFTYRYVLGRVQNPGELSESAIPVQVKVLKFDRERERVSLGY